MSHAVMLVMLTAWHAVLIALPIAAVTLACMRAGMRDMSLLALCGFSGGGVVAYLLFWIWWASPTAGALASAASLAFAAAACAWFGARSGRGNVRHVAPLGMAAAAWAAYALFVLAFGLAPSGFQSPLNAMQHHFGLALPYDNELPFIFAQQITNDRVSVPMSLTWLSSDRPPLQTAYFLASGASLLPRPEVHYQIQGTLLQCLWLPAMWVLLQSFGIARAAVFAALAVTMFSGFALIEGLFIWPKLFPVAYIALGAAILLNASRETLANWRAGAAVGVSLALAMLCHPGSFFVIPGLAAAMVLARRIPGARFVAGLAFAALLVALPWIYYQKYVDPPANRLMKWHLADVQDVDPRSVAEAVRDAYEAITPEQFLHNKLKNLRLLVGPSESVGLVAKAATVGLDGDEAYRLRHLQFFHFPAALGVLALAPLAWLLPAAWRTREFAASMRLFAVCIFAAIPWVLIMFPPGGTVIHTGSFALICFLFAAAMLAMFAVSPWLAAAAFALDALITIRAYAGEVPLAQGATAADYQAFNVLAALALVASCAALWRITFRSGEIMVGPPGFEPGTKGL